MESFLVSGCLAAQPLAEILLLDVCFCFLAFVVYGSPNGGFVKCFVFVLNLFLVSFKFGAVVAYTIWSVQRAIETISSMGLMIRTLSLHVTY